MVWILVLSKANQMVAYYVGYGVATILLGYSVMCKKVDLFFYKILLSSADRKGRTCHINID